MSWWDLTYRLLPPSGDRCDVNSANSYHASVGGECLQRKHSKTVKSACYGLFPRSLRYVEIASIALMTVNHLKAL